MSVDKINPFKQSLENLKINFQFSNEISSDLNFSSSFVNTTTDTETEFNFEESFNNKEDSIMIIENTQYNDYVNSKDFYENTFEHNEGKVLLIY